jgi:hypothetical protein
MGSPDAAVLVCRAINVQLARVTRGQPRLLQSTRTGRSAARSGVAALLPKLMVRVRFPSPAPRQNPSSGHPFQGSAAPIGGRRLLSGPLTSCDQRTDRPGRRHASPRPRCAHRSRS